MTPMTDRTLVSDLVGRKVVDSTGDKIGEVQDVYLDDVSNEPDWLAVSTGWFGTKISFVPVEGISYAGDDVVVAYSKDMVKDAPRCDADGHLNQDEEATLYSYWGRPYDTTADTGTDIGGRRDIGEGDRDASLTRSEEELHLDKHTRESGRARLRKWVETEHAQLTIPIRREKARLVTEPADGTSGVGDLADDEREIVLQEEVVDVDKRTVPKERVRLEKDEVTEDVPVDETLRKERIAVDSDDDDIVR